VEEEAAQPSVVMELKMWAERLENKATALFATNIETPHSSSVV